MKKVFLKILQNSQENSCARVSGHPATLLKKRLWHRCFPVNFAKIIKTSTLKNISERLLLFIVGNKDIKTTSMDVGVVP